MAKDAKDERINVREAAKECGRNPETVRRWIWSGKLPAQKLGNQLFVKRGDLASYCRETAVVGYQAGGGSGLIDRMRSLREDIRVRVGNLDIDGTIEDNREERMRELEETRSEAGRWSPGTEAKPDFLERAMALQNRIKARGGKPINAARLIRQIREERINEL